MMKCLRATFLSWIKFKNHGFIFLQREIRGMIMNKENVCKLKLMYWYNVFITGGFALVILIFAFLPSLRNILAWQGTDPIIVSLIVPLFFIMAIYCIKFLSKPEEGILLLKIQAFYKPLAIVFIFYYMLTNKIHLFWGILIIAGLLLYIIGNIWSIPWKDKNIIKYS